MIQSDRSASIPPSLPLPTNTLFSQNTSDQNFEIPSMFKIVHLSDSKNFGVNKPPQEAKETAVPYAVLMEELVV